MEDGTKKKHVYDSESDIDICINAQQKTHRNASTQRCKQAMSSTTVNTKSEEARVLSSERDPSALTVINVYTFSK